MARAVKSFSYDTVEDRELSRKIDALEHGQLSEVVRAALRLYWDTKHKSATINDVYKVVRRIERKLEQGVVLSTPDSQQGGDPGEDVAGTEAAAANLAGWAV